MTDTNTNGVAARHSSETVEHFTPPEIVEAARNTMGGIDFDPFSCAEANEVVRADYYLDRDGFRLPWHGRAFVNPPGGKTGNESNQKRAWFKLVDEWLDGRVTCGVFVCFSVEMLQTTQVRPTGPLPLDFPICYPSRRIAYRQPGGKVGKSPPHSSCLILLPHALQRASMTDKFREAFGKMGKIVVPMV